jgi:hypothetical protein
MSPRVLKQLAILGYRCDVTMYPNRPALKRFVKNELSIGMLPSSEDTPRHPFKIEWPDQPQTIWEIPVSVASKLNETSAYPEKLLLGIPFHKIPNIINDNLSHPFPYLLAEMRTDVRTDKYNRAQFDKTIEYFIQHELATNMNYLTMDAFLNRLESDLC